MKTIQFTKTYRFAHQGINVRTYKEDDIVDIDENTVEGKRFLQATVDQDDAAVYVTREDEGEGEEKKQTKGAPENKSRR